MPETKTFPLNVLLTVTTNRLLTRPKDGGNGIGDLYEILSWMTNDSPMTHQLPRFAKECKPWLLRWFPEIGLVNLDQLDELRARGGEWNNILDQWLKNQLAAIPGLKETYDIPKIPMDDHDTVNPLQELVDMVGEDKVVVVTNVDTPL